MHTPSSPPDGSQTRADPVADAGIAAVCGAATAGTVLLGTVGNVGAVSVAAAVGVAAAAAAATLTRRTRPSAPPAPAAAADVDGGLYGRCTADLHRLAEALLGQAPTPADADLWAAVADLHARYGTVFPDRDRVDGDADAYRLLAGRIVAALHPGEPAPGWL